jgi:hypothetical protein
MLATERPSLLGYELGGRQPAKASLPMLVRLAGRVTEVREEQP